MSKSKTYFTNEVEKTVDNITDNYVMNVIDYANAKEKLEKVENIELVMYKENIDDHLYFAKEDYDAKMKSKYYNPYMTGEAIWLKH